MAQSYFPPRNASQSLPELGRTVADPVSASVDKIALADDVESAYIEQKDHLVSAIGTTRGILTDLRQFNKDSWVIRYPSLAHPISAEAATNSPSTGSASRGPLRRSLSFADDPSHLTEVELKPHKKTRAGLQRSVTLASIAEPTSLSPTEVEGSTTDTESEQTLIDANVAADFRVLRLDLKLGAPGSSSAPATLVSHLEKASIANLLDERIEGAIAHVDKIRTRVEDTSSKVLVTGDLNAGKSTFVNALLGREVMPVDQQPCTTLFCEVHDKVDNDGVEEAHVPIQGVVYDHTDESTFTRVPVADLEQLVAAEREEGQEPDEVPIKLYVSDTRPSSQSLLSNGTVSISLIDAPGLNRDSLKTTAVFARQSEIDVIVFCVSAENHFTLSAKEFLWNASNEKAYLFIVVNRFDTIRDKERCKRAVLEQIRQLSPRTYEDSENLVHFVDSNSALARSLKASGEGKTEVEAEGPISDSERSFQSLEQAFRSFVLIKRSTSKLLPASTYLSHILSDVDLLASSNAIYAEKEVAEARETLERARPIFKKMVEGREGLENSLGETEEKITDDAKELARLLLGDALERVGRGELAIDSANITNPKYTLPTLPAYPGLLGIWDYAKGVRQVLLASLDLAVKITEDEARVITTEGVKTVSKIGDAHMPAGVEKNKRVFRPEAMFVPRLKSSDLSKSKRRTSAIVAGGTQGLGIGLLSHRPELGDVSFVDIVDLHHHILAPFAHLTDKAELDEGPASALSTLGLGLGAVTMVGGKTIGARGLLEGVVRLSEFAGNEGTRKWIAPVLGAATLGCTIYFVLELPNSIPRTVGRRIVASLAQPADLSTVQTVEGHTLTSRTASTSEMGFLGAQIARVSREVRKVMRLASWEVQERFRGAMEERGKEVRGAEESEKRATVAKEWFEVCLGRTEKVRAEAGLVDA